MLPSIEKSTVFQTEMTKFRNTLDQLTNEEIKKDVESLMNRLISEVRKIDRIHTEPGSFKDLTGLDRSKETIASLRKKLHKICKDCNESIR
jgi:hypothetical protein